MQIACRSLPFSRPLRASVALGLCALLGSGLTIASTVPTLEQPSTSLAREALGVPVGVVVQASPVQGDEASSDVVPLHRPVPSILRPMPRPHLELAAVSEESFDDLSRPRPRSVVAESEFGSVRPAERAEMGVLLTEASVLVERPPTSLRDASALTCLAVSIYHEARDQPLLGQQAVAAVILRRVTAPRWGDTICAVVQPSQFSYLSEDYSFPPILEHRAWRQALTVAIEALVYGPTPLVADADHYHATYVSPSWGQEMQEVMRIGGHVFYRDPLSGSPAPAKTQKRAGRVQVAVKPVARSTY